MLFTLRKGDSLSEKGLTFWAPFRRSASSYGGSFSCRQDSQKLTLVEICYQFKYIEKNRHQQGSPWSERQVGVYHRFETGKGATLFLINASEDTRLQSRLQTLVSNESTAKSFREALLPHVLILNTYLDNWRWALQFYGEQCSSKVSMADNLQQYPTDTCSGELDSYRTIKSSIDIILKITRAEE